MKTPAEQCGGGVSEEKEAGEVFWTNSRGQQESSELHRYVSLKKMKWNSMEQYGSVQYDMHIPNIGLVSVCVSA